MIQVKPQIASYGSSYGKYGGNQIASYSDDNDIKHEDLNVNFESDGIVFNLFEKSINDYVLAQLGHPIITVELTPFQVKTCIDEGTSQLDFHSPQWSNQFAVFNASAGINVYELPRFMINNLSFVSYKKDGFGTLFGANNGSMGYDLSLAFLNSNKFFQNGGIGDFFLTQQYLKMMRRVLSQEGSWSIIDNKYIQLYPTPTETPTEVIIEYRAINSNTIHHAYRNWIQRYSLASAKGILGRIRGKYKSLPGPGGGSQLDGASLVAESSEEKKLLMEELISIEEPPMFSIG